MSRASDRARGSHDRPRAVVIMHSVLNLKCFWVPILEAMSREFDVTLYIRNDMPEVLDRLSLPCRVEFMPIHRQIAPLRDLQAIFAIWRQLRRDRPQLLQTITPKAGLVGMIAAWLARVPIRIHTYQGEVWCLSTGPKRKLLKAMDWLVGRLASDILAVSQTELEFLRREGVLGKDRGRVLGSGSISGVDLVQFDRSIAPDQALREALGLGGDEFVFVFIGRLQRDKGLHVLAKAYASVIRTVSRPTKLIVVGEDEQDLGAMMRARLGDKVAVEPFSDRPQDYLRLADAVVLPSFREGFGSVLIEGAAMGVPAVASRIYGVDCAVKDGETGLLFEAGDPAALAEAMTTLVEQPDLRRRLGDAALARVQSDFDQRKVIANLVAYYRRQLGDRKV